jgi:hypothetical protein
MGTPKRGDRIRWKWTSPVILTARAGERAEVVSVQGDADSRVTTFKNLDKGNAPCVVEGEIPETYYERE